MTHPQVLRLRRALVATHNTIFRLFMLEARLLGLSGRLAGAPICISAADDISSLTSHPIHGHPPVIIDS